MSAKIRIEVAEAGQGTRVWVDERELQGLEAVHLLVTPNASRLMLTYVAPLIHIEGQVPRVESEQWRVDEEADDE